MEGAVPLEGARPELQLGAELGGPGEPHAYDHEHLPAEGGRGAGVLLASSSGPNKAALVADWALSRGGFAVHAVFPCHCQGSQSGQHAVFSNAYSYSYRAVASMSTRG